MAYKSLDIKDILNRTKDFDRNKDNADITAREFGLSYVLECFVCGIGEIAVRADWPEGWQELKQYPNIVLCPICAEKLKNWIKTGKREGQE